MKHIIINVIINWVELIDTLSPVLGPPLYGGFREGVTNKAPYNALYRTVFNVNRLV